MSEKSDKSLLASSLYIENYPFHKYTKDTSLMSPHLYAKRLRIFTQSKIIFRIGDFRGDNSRASNLRCMITMEQKKVRDKSAFY